MDKMTTPHIKPLTAEEMVEVKGLHIPHIQPNGSCPMCRLFITIEQAWEEVEQLQEKPDYPADIVELYKQIDTLRDILQEAQWLASTPAFRYCFRCLQRKDIGHADDCPIPIALGERGK